VLAKTAAPIEIDRRAIVQTKSQAGDRRAASIILDHFFLPEFGKWP
jgi:hypothetical protein